MDKRSLIFVIALSASLYFVNQWFAPKAKTETVATIIQTPKTAPLADASDPKIPDSGNSSDEKFYVLENAYQQLVFSNMGGSISEINLPFTSEKNKSSVVRPVGFDEKMQTEYSYSDHFPSFPYYRVNSSGSVEYMKKTEVGGYYPLLRRDLFASNGKNLQKVQPQFYACALKTDDVRNNASAFSVRRFTKNLIEFEGTIEGKKIIKTYELPADPAKAPYSFELTIRTDGDARGLSLSSGIPEVEIVSGSSAPILKYLYKKNGKPAVSQLKLPKNEPTISSVSPEWISNSNGFLGIIIDPLDSVAAGFSANLVPGDVVATRLSLIDSQYDLYPKSKYPGYETVVPFRPQGNVATYRVYAGPYQTDLLKQVDQAYTENGKSPYYNLALSFQGWFTFISEPFAKFLFVLMTFFHFITRSWGISIILLTVALRIMLYPLNAWSLKATAKMQKVGPEVQKIQEKYKKDPKRAQQETVLLYRQHGVNPFSGCIPMLIQLPFLFGMFDLLKSTFELRGAPFIPYWITNLTAPDVVFSWNYPIPFFGTSLHLLPILLGGVMFFQQKMNSPKTQKNMPLTDQQRQQKFMGNIMTVLFTVMFYHFPSGLNLYWLSSMILGIGQQWWMMKQMNKPKVEVLK